MKQVRFIQRISAAGLALLIGSMALADELVPATSEDLAQFDMHLSRQAPKPSGANPASVQSFGKKVSAEAMKLNSQDPSQMKKFGNWVKSQRQMDDNNRSGKDRDREREREHGVSNLPTNGSAFPGNSGQQRERERRRKGKD